MMQPRHIGVRPNGCNYKVVEVLSKHAGLWITRDKEIMYSQATHINFICPMRFDNFPLDTQVKPYNQHLLNYLYLHGVKN